MQDGYGFDQEISFKKFGNRLEKLDVVIEK